MKKILQWSNSIDRIFVGEQLKYGTIILGSTDTVIGLFAPCTLKAKEQLDVIKHRSAKPYIILINSLENLYQWADIEYKDAFLDLIATAWPGPLTVLVNAHYTAPVWLQSERGTLAFRWPFHKGIQELIERTGPLLSTSANLSGSPTPHCYDELDSYFIDNFSPIILENFKHRARSSSTILDCTVWPFKILRAGSYKI